MKVICARILAFAFLFLCSVQNSRADCVIPFGQDAINRFPVIFEGVVEREGFFLFPGLSDNFSFKVNRVFKGKLEDTKLVTVNVGGGAKYKKRAFQEGKLYLVFLYKGNGDKDYQTGPCTPNFSYEAINSHGGFGSSLIPTLINVVEYSTTSDKERYKTLQDLIIKMPNISELYEAQGRILARGKKYNEALVLYETAVRVRYKVSMTNKHGDKGPGGNLGSYTQQFLDNPILIPDHAFIHRSIGAGNIVLEYARVLYDMGRYQEALEVLGIADDGGANNNDVKALRSDLLNKLDGSLGGKN